MSNDKKTTQGVKTLLGDPKKAIIKLSVPMMFAMLIQSFYNIADGIWVAGLGADQLAAVGLFFPFFMAIIALGTGIGAGGSSAVARRIGEKNKVDADNTAVHTLLLGLAVALLISLPILPFLNKIFFLLSANKSVGEMAAGYARILFGGTIVMVFAHMANAILRGEGDAKRSMYAMLIGSILNIFLDPIFIYVLDMGVVGAAWATMISICFSALLVTYWLFFKKDTYLEITFRDFKPSKKILNEILKVGIPASLAQLSMSIAIIFLNGIVIKAGGTDGIAVFTSGWRIIMFGTIPLIGMATGVTAVTAAAFGAGDRQKLKTAFYYAIKIGVLIELCIAIIVAIFSRQLAYIFTYSQGSAHLLDDLIMFLRITSIIFPTVPLGMLTSAMFRGVGEGNKSLVVTILRTIILQAPVAYLLAIVYDLGISGVWLGIVIGNIIAVIITFNWGRYTVNHIL